MSDRAEKRRLRVPEITYPGELPVAARRDEIAELVGAGETFDDLTRDRLESFDRRFQPEDLDRLDPARSVELRATQGGGSTASVDRQIDALEAMLEQW